MNVGKYFEKDYDIIDLDAERERVSAFLKEAQYDDKPSYCEPLMAIYLHKNNREMFLVLDCTSYETDKIKDICIEWENKVLGFVNFERSFENDMEYLKYNVSLIILCTEETGEEDNDFRNETEKSINICKKIFLLCNNDGEIEEGDNIILPFYFEPIYKVNDNKTEQLERKFEKLLDIDDEILDLIDKGDFDDIELEKLNGWFKNYANN